LGRRTARHHGPLAGLAPAVDEPLFVSIPLKERLEPGHLDDQSAIWAHLQNNTRVEAMLVMPTPAGNGRFNPEPFDDDFGGNVIGKYDYAI